MLYLICLQVEEAHSNCCLLVDVLPNLKFSSNFIELLDKEFLLTIFILVYMYRQYYEGKKGEWLKAESPKHLLNLVDLDDLVRIKWF